jgi:crotonobetainyl-CoA:carnitine CoA-transferase CaiB-like acyl-CoA transferase
VASADAALVAPHVAGPAVDRHQAFLESNPRMVVTAITPFGLTGPYRDFRGSDPVYAALSGLLSQSGIGAGEPLVPPRGIVENSAALQAAWATVVALFHAQHSGEGQLIDLSVFEAVAQIIDPPFGVIGSARAALDPSLSEARDRGRPNMPYLYPNVRCEDGYVRIAILGTRQWRGLLACIGTPPALAGEHFEKMGNRFLSWNLIQQFIEEFFATRSVRELIELGEEHGFPVAEVLDLDSASQAEHFLDCSAFVPVKLPSGKDVRLASGFLEVDEGRSPLDVVAAAPGADNETLLGIPGTNSAPPEKRGVAKTVVARLKPLAGLRILDLGVIVVGAETGRLLADLGADVVKVENLRFPDGLRMGPSGPTVTPTFAWGHRNKRSIGVDLRSPSGRDLFVRLVQEADAVLSNFKAGTLQSLGIGYEALSEINPKIVVGESSAYGATGPWSGRLGYGPLVRGSVGLADLWRYPDQAVGFGDSVTVFPDHANGRVMAAAIVAGIMRAEQTGRGCHVRSAQAETIINVLSSEYLRASVAPGEVRATGNQSSIPDLPSVYQCAGDDEWCVIDVQNGEQLQAVLGLCSDSVDARPAERIATWALDRTKHDVMWACQRAGVPAGSMIRPMETLEDPHLRTRGHFTVLRQPGLSDLPAERGPALFSTIAQPELRPAPRFGQHTRQVLEEWLHLSSAEISDLAAAGVLQFEKDAEPQEPADRPRVEAVASGVAPE